jgi:hypothetical protein
MLQPKTNMKSVLSIIIAIACSISFATAEETTGEMGANPFFKNANDDHWTYSGKWRPDGDHPRLVIDIDDQNVGFPSAVGRGKYLNLNAAGNDISNSHAAILTGFIFNTPYIAAHNACAIGPNANYILFFEIDVVTTSGTHRAKSQTFKNPRKLPKGDFALKFDWLCEGNFLSAPSSMAQGGIPVQSI